MTLDKPVGLEGDKHILVKRDIKQGYSDLISKTTTWNKGMEKILKYIDKNKEDFLKFRDTN